MARKLWQLTALGIGCAALAACGSSGGSKSSGGTTTSKPASGAASGAKVDVCSIITAEDAATVVGSPAKQQAPSSSELAPKGVCIYKKDTTDIAVNLLQIRVYGGPQFYGEQIFADAKSIKVKGAQKAFVNVKTAGEGAANYDLQFVKDNQTGALNYTATGGAGADQSATIAAMQKLADQLAAAL